MKKSFFKRSRKSSYTLLASALLAVSACNRTEELVPTPATWATAAPAMTVQQLENYMKETMQKTQSSFNWNRAPQEAVWSALAYSDQILSVGYKPAQMTEQEVERQLGQLDLQSGAWQSAREQLLALILAEEQKLNPAIKQSDIVQFREFGLPFVGVSVRNPSTIAKLRTSSLVRYAEPMGFEPSFTQQAPPSTANRAGRVESSQGCDDRSSDFSLQAGVDYVEIQPKALISWNYPYHQLPQAWSGTGGVTGKGIGVAIFDSGLSVNQDNLNSNGFNSGVPGRTLEAKNAVISGNSSILTPQPSGYNDLCSHGTALAGVIAAPRGNSNSMMGVAYGCNLFAYRASNDVYLDQSEEVYGVASSFYDAGNNPAIKIISMSMGRVGDSDAIKDAITYAYERNKLIFCASGTLKWVSFLSYLFPDLNNLVFPVNLNSSVYGKDIVQGVSGITTSYERCDDCVVGGATDFVVVMQRATDGSNRKPLAMPRTGNFPTTIGGSSVATATMAGMAALVWSKDSNSSRAQVLAKLQQASNNYPNRAKLYGWGTLNAATATQAQNAVQ